MTHKSQFEEAKQAAYMATAYPRGRGATHRMLMRAGKGEVIVVVVGTQAYNNLRRDPIVIEKELLIIACEPTSDALLEKLRGIRSKVHLDHHWVERYILNQMDHAQTEVELVLMIAEEK